ncbi:hypothetical protein ANCCEY_15497, partial [Ancylostoma ceylanicum]
MPADQTVFKIDLEYFNISSSKRILFLLYKLNNLAKNPDCVRVEWYYREDDEDMFEVGGISTIASICPEALIVPVAIR